MIHSKLNKRVAICIPVYNGKNTIIQTISNLLNQTYDNYDIVIYDDGSTDETVTVLHKHFSQNPKIQIVVGEKNYGRSYARNRLLELAEDRLIAWQDADDLWHPHKLFVQTQLLEETKRNLNKKIIYTTVKRFPPKYSKLYRQYAELIFGKQQIMKLDPPKIYDAYFLFSKKFGTCPFYLQGTLGLASTYREAGGFPSNLNWAEDIAMLVNLLKAEVTIEGYPTDIALTMYYLNIPSVTPIELQRSIMTAVSLGNEIKDIDEDTYKSDLIWRNNFYIFRVALLKKDINFANNMLEKMATESKKRKTITWYPELFTKNKFLLNQCRAFLRYNSI